MTIDDVKRSVFRQLTKRLTKYARHIAAADVSNSLVTVYPTMLLLTETPSSLIYELTGASTEFRGLKSIHQKCDSNPLYFGQFEEHQSADPAVINFDRVVKSKICGVGCYACDDKDRMLQRFAFLSGPLHQGGFFANGTRGIFIGDLVDLIEISDTIIVNQHSGELRVKYINNCGVINKWTPEELVGEFIDDQFRADGRPPGVIRAAPQVARKLLLSAQFSSLFLSPHVQEPKLGMFLAENPDFLKIALRTNDFIPERTFHWQPPRETDSPIRPDLMVQRDDGYYDIYDLKTSLLSKKVTRKHRARRRFTSELEDGLSQLAHYNEYFTTPENQSHILAMHKIEVRQPKLYLIAGNEFNTKALEVREALRRFNIVEERFYVVSYDALVLAFVMAEN